MKRTIWVSVLGLVLAGAVVAYAQIPGNPHVDSHAPCFRWPAVDMDGDGVFDRLDNCPDTPKGCSVDQYGCSTDGDGDGVCDGVDKCPDTPKGTEVDESGCPGRGSAVEQPPPPPPVETPKPAEKPAAEPMKPMERQLVETGSIRLENVYFETGSAQLLPESESTLREAGETLEKYPALRIEVQGHTDTRGGAAYNMRLSQSRAESVRSFLLDHFRLQGDNFVAKGYGETEPETQERNDEELLRNRRVVLKVLNPEALPKGMKVEGE